MSHFLILGLTRLFFLLQPPAAVEVGEGAASAAGASGAAPAGCAGGGPLTLGYIAAMIAIFWFLVISPQRKQQKAHEEMMATLQKGTIVRTSGGIRGEVIGLDERTVTLKIAEKTKINVLRANIVGPEQTDDEKS